MKLAEKVVVVTGAANGIGRAVALQLLTRKARVAATDYDEAGLRETVKLAGVGASITPFVVDVTKRAAVEALASSVVERFGVVDGVIQCAGIIQPFVKVRDLDYAMIDRVFDVNFRGVVYVTKSFLPLLEQRPVAHIVNVSSMGGFLPVPGQTAYGASKAAVKLFTEGLHSEMQGTNVRVTIVFPGAIDTNIVVNSGAALPKGADAMNRNLLTSPETAARTILDGMERDRFRVLIGKDALFLDWISRLDPRRAAAFVARQMKGLLQ